MLHLLIYILHIVTKLYNLLNLKTIKIFDLHIFKSLNINLILARHKSFYSSLTAFTDVRWPLLKSPKGHSVHEKTEIMVGWGVRIVITFFYFSNYVLKPNYLLWA